MLNQRQVVELGIEGHAVAANIFLDRTHPADSPFHKHKAPKTSPKQKPTQITLVGKLYLYYLLLINVEFVQVEPGIKNSKISQ